jgi:site-specific DNA-methyltransferase (adenine-specific)
MVRGGCRAARGGDELVGGTTVEAAKWKELTTPATEAGRQWAGWGSALKPAHEPICMARKPLEGTIAQGVLRWGTGALNIDGCRVPIDAALDASQLRMMNRGVRESGDGWGMSTVSGDTPQVLRADGRWPANLLHDGSPEVLDTFGRYSDGGAGSAARFFYCAKASARDRNEGLAGKNPHPTVKPVSLMSWLCRLVTPPGGLVLDPFMGSGSTGKGAVGNGFRFLGIDQNPEHVVIADQRIGFVAAGLSCGRKAV